MLGPWRITSEPRQAREGATYAAINATTWKVATLEVINAPALSFGSYLERMRSITAGLKRIEHRGVLDIFDISTLGDGRPYIVHEMLQGVGLSEIIAAGKPSTETAIGLLRDVCDVLRAAHAAGVVHRAVELDHVLLVGDPGSRYVKLLDWGISEAIADEARLRGKLGTSATRERRMLSPKLDVYAVGLLAHQLFEKIPSSLDALWLAMMSDHEAARPTIAEVAKALAALELPAATELPIVASASAPLPDPPHSESNQSNVSNVSSESNESNVSNEPEESNEPASHDSGKYDAVSPVTMPWPRSSWRSVVGIAAAAAVLLVLVTMVGSSDREISSAPVKPAPMRERIATPSVPPTRSMPAPGVAPIATSEPAPQEVAPIATSKPAPLEVAPPAKPTPPPTTTYTVRKQAAKPAVSDNAGPPKADKRSLEPDRELMTQYQRVGHELLVLQRQASTPATAELWSRFRSIRIEAAMASPKGRRGVAAILVQLQADIEASK